MVILDSENVVRVEIDTKKYEDELISTVKDMARNAYDDRQDAVRRGVNRKDLADQLEKLLPGDADVARFRAGEDRVSELFPKLTDLSMNSRDQSATMAIRSIRKDMLELSDLERKGAPETEEEFERTYMSGVDKFIEGTRANADRLANAIETAIKHIPSWEDVPVSVRANPNRDVWFEKPVEAFTVEMGRGSMAPSFIVFVDGSKYEVDDVLEGGDTDFFREPMLQANYFALVKELRDPGSSSKRGRDIVLYTARPSKDRRQYEGAKSVPVNIFLTNDPDRAYGLATDLGGGRQRDLWKVVINERDLIVTLDAGRTKDYQVVGQGATVPVKRMELISQGESRVEESMGPENITGKIGPTTSTPQIIKMALDVLKQGKKVALGNPDAPMPKTSDDPQPEWTMGLQPGGRQKGLFFVKAPTVPYPFHFETPEDAADFFVRSWIKGKPVDMNAGVVRESVDDIVCSVARDAIGEAFMPNFGAWKSELDVDAHIIETIMAMSKDFGRWLEDISGVKVWDMEVAIEGDSVTWTAPKAASIEVFWVPTVALQPMADVTVDVKVGSKQKEKTFRRHTLKKPALSPEALFGWARDMLSGLLGSQGAREEFNILAGNRSPLPSLEEARRRFPSIDQRLEEPEAKIKSGRPIKPINPGKVKVRKGIYYFPSYKEARKYAEDRRWKTDRIVAYEVGWAIQKMKSGPYYGPEDENQD
jgi:hypothetical protein